MEVFYAKRSLRKPKSYPHPLKKRDPGCAQMPEDDKELRPLPSVLQMQKSVVERGEDRRRPICLLKEFYVLRAAS